MRAYLAELLERIAQSVVQADAGLTVCSLAAARVPAAGVGFNRRFFMKDGTLGWNPSKNSKQIIEPAGPVDDSVQLVVARNADGTPMLVSWNFAMHLDTVGGTMASADYPATTARLLKNVLGEDTAIQFTIGCPGDINHRDVGLSDRQKGHSEAASVGIFQRRQ